jgi:hypothetical protein
VVLTASVKKVLSGAADAETTPYGDSCKWSYQLHGHDNADVPF